MFAAIQNNSKIFSIFILNYLWLSLYEIYRWHINTYTCTLIVLHDWLSTPQKQCETLLDKPFFRSCNVLGVSSESRVQPVPRLLVRWTNGVQESAWQCVCACVCVCVCVCVVIRTLSREGRKAEWDCWQVPRRTMCFPFFRWFGVFFFLVLLSVARFFVLLIAFERRIPPGWRRYDDDVKGY